MLLVMYVFGVIGMTMFSDQVKKIVYQLFTQVNNTGMGFNCFQPLGFGIKMRMQKMKKVPLLFPFSSPLLPGLPQLLLCV